MRRSWPLVVLLLLLQPRAAAAEVWAYGWPDPYASAPASERAGEREAVIRPADGLEPGASMRDPTEHPDRLPQGPALRPAARPRLAQARPHLAAPAHSPGDRCPPLCERLPYDATAPPLR